MTASPPVTLASFVQNTRITHPDNFNVLFLVIDEEKKKGIFYPGSNEFIVPPMEDVKDISPITSKDKSRFLWKISFQGEKEGQTSIYDSANNVEIPIGRCHNPLVVSTNIILIREKSLISLIFLSDEAGKEPEILNVVSFSSRARLAININSEIPNSIISGGNVLVFRAEDNGVRLNCVIDLNTKNGTVLRDDRFYEIPFSA